MWLVACIRQVFYNFYYDMTGDGCERIWDHLTTRDNLPRLSRHGPLDLIPSHLNQFYFAQNQFPEDEFWYPLTGFAAPHDAVNMTVFCKLFNTEVRWLVALNSRNHLFFTCIVTPRRDVHETERLGRNIVANNTGNLPRPAELVARWQRFGQDTMWCCPRRHFKW
jgi:hypothetical protein